LELLQPVESWGTSDSGFRARRGAHGGWSAFGLAGAHRDACCVGQAVGVERTKVGRLVILCGLAGSGKSTVAVALERAFGAVRLSSDEWLDDLGFDLDDESARARVEDLQQRLAVEMVSCGTTVIYESGGWTRAERDALRDAARSAGATVEFRFLDVPIEVLWPRLEARNAALPPATAVIEHHDLVSWASQFERPDEDELATYDERL
jgi:predicted kinase